MRQNCSYTSPSSARYYNSALSIWLSVDPMSDKYPGVSPYVYCGNNPVRLVDLDGRDIWEINANGEIVNHQKTADFDQFIIIDSEGWRHESDAFAPGTFTLWEREDWSVLSFRVNETTETDLDPCNRNVPSKAIFDLIKEYSNIEWECMYTDEGHYLGTTYEDHSCNLHSRDGYLSHWSKSSYAKKRLGACGDLIYFEHNHPSDERMISEGDHNVAELYPDAIFRLSPRGCPSTPYDRTSKYLDKTGIERYPDEINK